MKKHIHGILLLASVSAVTLLSACDSSDIRNPFEPNRDDQVVSGMRRAPINQRVGTAPAAPVQPVVSAPEQPASAAPARPVSREAGMMSSPYDYYDDRGNELDKPLTPPPAVNATASAPKEEGNFFTRLFDGDSASKSNPKPEEQQPRKPITSNPYYYAPTQTAPAAPAPQVIAPQTQPEIISPKTQPEVYNPSHVPDDAYIPWNPQTSPRQVPPASQLNPSAASQEAPAPVKQEIAPPPASVEPSQAPQNNSSGVPDDAYIPWNPNTSPYPVRSGEPLKTNQQFVPPAPQETPAPLMEPQAMQQPEPQMSPQQQAEAAPAPAPKKKHGFFARMFGADEETKPAPASAPQPQASAPASSQPTWFDRWMGKNPPQSDLAQKEKAPSLSSVPQTPEEFEAVRGEQGQRLDELQNDHYYAQQEKGLLDTEPSQQGGQPAAQPYVPQNSAPAHNGQPVLLGHASSLPPTEATAAPVAPVATNDEQEQSQQPVRKTTPGGLPSPDMLDEVKVIPPSRYSNQPY